jgi:hypothetical protein
VGLEPVGCGRKILPYGISHTQVVRALRKGIPRNPVRRQPGREVRRKGALARAWHAQLIGVRTQPSDQPSPPMSLKRKMRRRGQAAGHLLEIVHGPIPQLGDSRLSPEIRDALPRLHALLHDDPRAAVPELRTWIEREPLPMFYNWLGMAYSSLGNDDAAAELVRENYRRNPKYLFARLNFAEICLRDGDLAGAREALGAGFDIRPLLGGRKRVHVSELAGYYYAVGVYHIAAGDVAAAEKIYELLAEAAPDELPTEELRRRLYPRLRDIFRRRLRS